MVGRVVWVACVVSCFVFHRNPYTEQMVRTEVMKRVFGWMCMQGCSDRHHSSEVSHSNHHAAHTVTHLSKGRRDLPPSRAPRFGTKNIRHDLNKEHNTEPVVPDFRRAALHENTILQQRLVMDDAVTAAADALRLREVQAITFQHARGICSCSSQHKQELCRSDPPSYSQTHRHNHFKAHDMVPHQEREDGRRHVVYVRHVGLPAPAPKLVPVKLAQIVSGQTLYPGDDQDDEHGQHFPSVEFLAHLGNHVLPPSQ